MKYIKGLDALRAFAVIFVIMTHWGPHSFNVQPLKFIFQYLVPDGMFGVDLFFVLSGYLITAILLHARNENSGMSKGHIIKTFYYRRILRIFPIYYLLLLVLAIIGSSYLKEHIFYFLSYTSNFLVFKERSWVDMSHTWSLSVEEQFYLIWPWIIIYVPKRHLLKAILLAIALGIGSTLILNALYGSFSVVLLPACIVAFGIGALFSYISVYKRYEKVFKTTLLILIPLCLCLFYIDHNIHNLVLIRLVNSVISIGAIFYAVNYQKSAVSKYLLRNTLLVNIGKISYGLYLYHLVISGYYTICIDKLIQILNPGSLVIKLLTVPPPAYFIMLAVLAIIATLSYNYIELNFLRLKRRMTYVFYRKDQPHDERISYHTNL